MKLLRKLTKSQTFRKGIARVISLYIKLVYKTTPWVYENRHVFEEHIALKKPMIVAFWHGRLGMLPCAWQWNRPFYMLLSKHSDGQIISHVLEDFGIHSIFGSSTRGGTEAGLSIIDKLKEGGVVGFTPDGPRGPTQKCSKGVVKLAKLASETLGDVSIIPLSYGVSHHKRLRSWDRFMVPFPFGRKGCFVLGHAIVIHKYMSKDDLDLAKNKLEAALDDVQDKADNLNL